MDDEILVEVAAEHPTLGVTVYRYGEPYLLYRHRDTGNVAIAVTGDHTDPYIVIPGHRVVHYVIAPRDMYEDHKQ